jgi:hypothetical protein
MILFEKYFKLVEAAGPNKHLTHLEELVLTHRKEGADRALAYITAMTDILESDTDRPVNATVKYDGAPAVVIGRDLNGNFFVGSKSVFNKVPKLNYSIEDIKTNHSAAPGLVDKLIQTFIHFKDLNIDSVYQGDFLFDNDIKKTQMIDGKEHVIFKPNTIVYAVPTDSDEGRQIIDAKIGVVFHTEYNVDADEEGNLRFNTKQFGVNVSNINPDRDVYVKDAFFENDAGTITLTDDETKLMNNIIDTGIELSNSINYDIADSIYTGLNTYLNTEIRQGEFIKDSKVSFQQFVEWITGKLDKKIDSLKSERGKAKASDAKEEMLSAINIAKDNIVKMFNLQNLIKRGKDVIISKYNNIMRGVQMKHYLFDDNGDLVVTDPEGYVCVDQTGNAIKFVDRLEFSRANFSIDKSAKFEK